MKTAPKKSLKAKPESRVILTVNSLETRVKALLPDVHLERRDYALWPYCIFANEWAAANKHFLGRGDSEIDAWEMASNNLGLENK